MLMPSLVMRTTSSLTAGEPAFDQLVAFFDADGDDAAFADVREIFKRSLFHRAFLGGKEHVLRLRPGDVFLCSR